MKNYTKLIHFEVKSRRILNEKKNINLEFLSLPNEIIGEHSQTNKKKREKNEDSKNIIKSNDEC